MRIVLVAAAAALAACAVMKQQRYLFVADDANGDVVTKFARVE